MDCLKKLINSISSKNLKKLELDFSGNKLFRDDILDVNIICEGLRGMFTLEELSLILGSDYCLFKYDNLTVLGNMLRDLVNLENLELRLG